MAMTTTPRGATPRSARASGSSGPPVPFLPGYSVGADIYSFRKTNFTKPQITGRGGPAVISKLNLSTLDTLTDPHHRYDMSARTFTHDERESARDTAKNTYRPEQPPSWLRHDRQVLRFFGYFQEPAHENPKEGYRVRQCHIYYYLEDGSMMVSEPKIENSGILAGTFVKRHRIPKPQSPLGADNPYYAPEDLRVGMLISIYSRVFKIYDCDEFTRAFYGTAMDLDVGEPNKVPLDAYQRTRQHADDRPVFTSRDIAEGKEFNELALGGARKNAKLQQYIENDRKVLCFKAFWDDPTRYGSRMYFTLHYYLSDDSVEMLENLARNSGRDPYPVFWRRAPLCKNPHGSHAPGMLEPEQEIYKPEDFVVGQTVSVYGRHILLFDCDDFTREFYIKYANHEQGTVVIEEPEQVHSQLEHSPHTGFGTEEDSLASCLHLTPRMPKRDINKLMRDGDLVLRFSGRMLTDTPEDIKRRFVVTICLADDSVAVFEVRSKNSGHAAGKFASSSKKKNPATGAMFVPQDFFVGATVEVCAVPFKLVDADEGTLKYMESHQADFPVSDMTIVARKVAGLRDVLVEASSFSVDEIRELAEERFGVRLNPHELLTISRLCLDDGSPGRVLSATLLNFM